MWPAIILRSFHPFVLVAWNRLSSAKLQVCPYCSVHIEEVRKRLSCAHVSYFSILQSWLSFGLMPIHITLFSMRLLRYPERRLLSKPLVLLQGISD
ncbi:hypothetical protein GE21DRAFT_1101038 [Neurospora crassa]|nr:hypothetical protein GE21DRAFT_1101038 [Neurospora crassa]